MRPALYYISETSLGSAPSATEADARRQARIAEVRSLLAEIAEEPRRERQARTALPRDAAAGTCRRERLVA